MSHPTLFDAPPTTGTARRSDQPTSIAAAKSLDAETMHRELRRVLNAIVKLDASPNHEATTGRINRLLGDRQRNCTARRVRDLVEGGLVEDTGRTFREDRKGDEIVWRPVR